jgi:hypothetical protein
VLCPGVKGVTAEDDLLYSYHDTSSMPVLITPLIPIDPTEAKAARGKMCVPRLFFSRAWCVALHEYLFSALRRLAL